MANATAINTMIKVESEIFQGAIYCLKAECKSSDEYLKLPVAIEYEGAVYTKMSWNSDTNYACYKTGGPNCLAVKLS